MKKRANFKTNKFLQAIQSFLYYLNSKIESPTNIELLDGVKSCILIQPCNSKISPCIFWPKFDWFLRPAWYFTIFSQQCHEDARCRTSRVPDSGTQLGMIPYLMVVVKAGFWVRWGSSMMASSTKTTMRLTSVNQVTNWMKGGITVASRTFLMTRTVRGGLYQVNLWEAGSWMVLERNDENFVKVEWRMDCLERWLNGKFMTKKPDFYFWRSEKVPKVWWTVEVHAKYFQIALIINSLLPMALKRIVIIKFIEFIDSDMMTLALRLFLI